MNTHFFVVPFAAAGDKADIPEIVQPDGSISFPDGYSAYYALDPETTPGAILIDRETFNGLMFDITSSLAALQSDFPQWITSTDNLGSPFPYNKGAVTRYQDGQLWYSLVTANTATPGSDPTKWILFGSQWATTAQLNAEIARAMAAEALLAPINSPLFTGSPQAPTQAPGTGGNLLATCSYVIGAVAAEQARAMAAENLLAPKSNPTLVGPNVIVPTYGAGENSGRVASTAYADAAVAVERNRAISAEAALAPITNPNFNSNAYLNGQELATEDWVSGVIANLNLSGNSGWYQIGPFIVQWDTVGCSEVSQRINFPRSFPNACLKVITVEGNANDSTWGVGNPTLMAPGPPDASGVEVWALIWEPAPYNGWQGAAPGRPTTCAYIAIGW